MSRAHHSERQARRPIGVVRSGVGGAGSRLHTIAGVFAVAAAAGLAGALLARPTLVANGALAVLLGAAAAATAWGAAARRRAGATQWSERSGLRRAFLEMRWRVHRYQQELRAKQLEVEEANARLRAQNEELQRTNEVLGQLSITDELTGLHNHRFFRDQLPREMKRALRSGEPLALVLFDIDDFKQLNDRHGHAVGDAVLKRVAGVMNDQVREVDLLARYGGEEFALLASHTPVEGAVALAEKIRLAVGSARFPVVDLDGRLDVHVTISAGVAGFDGDERALFIDADRALYRAKASGKDCVVAAGDDEADSPS